MIHHFLCSLEQSCACHHGTLLAISAPSYEWTLHSAPTNHLHCHCGFRDITYSFHSTVLPIDMARILFFDQKTKMLSKTTSTTMTTTGPLYCLGRCQYMKPTPFYSAHSLILTHYSIPPVPAFLVPFFPFTATAISFVYSTHTFFRSEIFCLGPCLHHFSFLQ